MGEKMNASARNSDVTKHLCPDCSWRLFKIRKTEILVCLNILCKRHIIEKEEIA